MMKESGAKGVSCPVASAHHGGTTSPYVSEMLALGIDICLGSDAAPSGNSGPDGQGDAAVAYQLV